MKKTKLTLTNRNTTEIDIASLKVDGIALRTAGATLGQALMFNGTDFVPVTINVGDSHTHDASHIISGTLADERLGENVARTDRNVNFGQNVYAKGADGFQAQAPDQNGIYNGISLNWHNGIARLRIGGDGSNAYNDFQIQGVGNNVRFSVDNAGNATIPGKLNVKSGTIQENGVGLADKYAAKQHTHNISDITNLWPVLDNKSALNHSHTSLARTVSLFKDGDAAPLTFGTEFKMDITSTGDGAVNWPINNGKVISFGSRYASGWGSLQFFVGEDNNKVRFRTNKDSNTWMPWVKIASEEWVNERLAGTHTHEIANINGLQAALDLKAAGNHSHPEYALTAHSHAEYALKAHTHAIADVGGLQSALDSKAASSHTHNTLANIGSQALSGSSPSPDWGTELKMVIISLEAGNHEGVPANYGKIISFGGRYAPNGSATLQFFAPSTGGAAPSFRTSNGSGWGAWGTLPSQEWVIGQKYAKSVNGVLPDANGNIVISTSGTATSVEWGSILNRPSTFTPSTHQHSWNDITDKPSFAIEGHTHTIAGVTGLQAALDSKAAANHTHDWNSITNKPDFAGSHTHDDRYYTEAEVDEKLRGITYAPRRRSVDTKDQLINYRGEAASNPGVTVWVAADNNQYRYNATSDSWYVFNNVMPRVSSQQDGLFPAQYWSTIENMYTRFAPFQHTHQISDVEGLQSALDSLSGGSGGGTGAHDHDDRYYTKWEQRDLGLLHQQTRYMGTVTDQSELPATASKGDVWYVYKSGMPANTGYFVWDAANASWVELINYVQRASTVYDGMMSRKHYDKVEGMENIFYTKEVSDTRFAPLSHRHNWNEIDQMPSTFPASAHTHPISQVTGLQTALNNLSGDLASGLSTKSDKGHTHSYNDLLDKPTAFEPAAHSHSWDAITGKPTTFMPAAHTHGISQVNGLQLELDNINTAIAGRAAASHTHLWADITDKPTTFAPSAHSHSWSSITGKPTVFAPSAHTHDWADITNKPDLSGASHTHDYASLTNIPTSFTPAAHSHSWSSITSKPTSFTPAAHTHAIADVTDLQTTLDGKAAASHNHDDRYYTEAEIDAKLSGIATSGHTHAIADVTGLQTALNGKAATSHTHTIAQVTNLQATLDGKAASSHSHAMADITGLDAALTGKASTSHSHTWGSITSKPSTLTGFGITDAVKSVNGTLPDSAGNVVIAVSAGSVDWSTISNKPATFTPAAHNHEIADITNLQTTLNGKAASSHNHSAANITSGTLAVARGGTGLASITTGNFLVGNGTSAMVQKTPAEVLADIGAAASSHSHSWSQITSKPSTFTPSAHSHSEYIKTVNGVAPDTAGNVQIATGGGTATSVAWADVTGKPTTFTPSAHTHTIANITNLQTTLDGKAAASHTHTIAQITNLQTELDGKAASSHSHSWSSITSKPNVVLKVNGVTPDTSGNVTIATGGGSTAWADITGKPAFASANTASAVVQRDSGGSVWVTNLYASAQVQAKSDARLKDNVQDYENGLEKVMALRPVSYTRNDLQGKEEIGLISQEVKEVEPLAAGYDEATDTHTLDYSRLTVLLIKGMQEQQQMIDELKAEIVKLKGGAQ